ncbi:MAG: hypothetical protein ACFFB2_00905 [Promethearchaeota archaeon]
MKEFKEIQKICIYHDGKICTFWPEETQCHFIACPLFSYKVLDEIKYGIKKRLTESVIFDVTDFDRNKTTTLDLIHEVQTNELIYPKKANIKTMEASMIRKSVQRMKCVVCGEQITDDKFTTIRDPIGVLIYIHSKGKCQARKDQILAIREKWLRNHTSGA